MEEDLHSVNVMQHSPVVTKGDAVKSSQKMPKVQG
jgi:hypothetical protein